MQKIDRTGEENINKQGLKMQIIRYKNVHDYCETHLLSIFQKRKYYEL